jgi:hypothetical protein
VSGDTQHVQQGIEIKRHGNEATDKKREAAPGEQHFGRQPEGKCEHGETPSTLATLALAA